MYAMLHFLVIIFTSPQVRSFCKFIFYMSDVYTRYVLCMPIYTYLCVLMYYVYYSNYIVIMSKVCDVLIQVHVAYMYLLCYGEIYQIMYCVRGCTCIEIPVYSYFRSFIVFCTLNLHL